MDFDRSTDRGAQKRSKFTIGLQHVHLRKSAHFYFRGPNNFSTARRWFLLWRTASIFRCKINRFGPIDRSRCSKTIEIYYWVAACPPKEIGAFLFSGPEQFFYGAPLISPLADRIHFSMQNQSIWTDRPLEVLKNDRNLLLGCSMST